MMYFDFAKAFDSVSHPELVHELQSYGFSGCRLNILKDFPSARTQRVVLPSGVPLQSSVLGPVLFLVYINDIVDLFANSEVCVKLYADDIKMYLEIISDSDQCTLLQNFQLFKTWQLKQTTHAAAQLQPIHAWPAAPSAPCFWAP